MQTKMFHPMTGPVYVIVAKYCLSPKTDQRISILVFAFDAENISLKNMLSKQFYFPFISAYSYSGNKIPYCITVQTFPLKHFFSK